MGGWTGGWAGGWQLSGWAGGWVSGLLFWCLVSLTDAKTSVGSQTAQGHDVEASLVF